MRLREKSFWVFMSSILLIQAAIYWCSAEGWIHWKFWVQAIPTPMFAVVALLDIFTGFFTGKK
jgi:hypothetical protein